MELIARETARKVCAVIKDDGKRATCIQLLTKILVYGESVKDEVREEINKVFTEEERRLIKEEISKSAGSLRWLLVPIHAIREDQEGH